MAIQLLSASDRRADNFLPLRHLAAVLVLYGHSYALAFNPGKHADVIAHAMPGFYAGSLAVHLFFAISGYLVTLSVLRTPGVLRYARNRALRVYPAYLACLLFCVLVLGPGFTTLGLGDYFASAETWNHVRQNLLPITFAWTLPGVFESNPVPRTVNGTLWSLGLEVRWYFYLGVLAALTVVRRRWLFSLVACAVIALGVWEWGVGKPDALGYRALSQTFLLGALVAQWRSHIVVSHWIMLALAAVAAITHSGSTFGGFAMIALIYFVIWVAYALPPLPWPRKLDASYGLFLYGFPVQQMLMALFPTLSPPALLASALACSGALALGSWYAIELPAMRWKHGASGGAAAGPAP
jgi:peptidoglycan/LPS O-acetylase OafA/YrhL